MHCPLLPLFLVAIIPAIAAAQNGDARSTKSGVYTREQAMRGKDIYAGNCRSCHVPESHTGDAFTTKWKGKPLSELFAYIRDNMPKNDPGSLSPEEYADVTAYLLLMNRLPQGDTDLRGHSDSLKSIRIDLPPMSVRKDP